MIGLLMAVSGIPDEPALVQGAPAHGMRVIRRCVDAVDLLAAAAMDPTAQAVVSADLPRLTADAVDRMRVDRRVVGLAVDGASADRLAALGAEPVLRVGASTEATLRMLAATVDHVRSDPDPEVPALPPAAGTPAGLLVAVWGPQGAPGRTTVAIGLAEALADAGRTVLLVDADTYAPSMTLALGVVEESSGLIVACRHAESGASAAGAWTSAVRRVRGDLHLLGGLPGPQRWPELRSGALERIWAAARESFGAVVVDVGFCVEQDSDVAAWGRRRNAAALTALAAADVVVAVADGSGSGAARLGTAWPALQAATGGHPVRIVRNRADARGPGWGRALAAAGIRAPIHPVPEDGRVLARAWRAGRTLGEAAPRSRARRALTALAREVLTAPSDVSPWILASR